MGLLTSAAKPGLLNNTPAKTVAPTTALPVNAAQKAQQFSAFMPSLTTSNTTPQTGGTDVFGTIVKNVVQGFARGTAAAGATIAGIPGQIQNILAGKPAPLGSLTPEPDSTSLGRFEQALYGTTKPISLGSEGAIGSIKEDSPIAIGIGAVSSGLDLFGAGEAKGLLGLTKTLTATKDVAEAATLLKKAGFADDIASNAAETFARLSNADEVKQGLLKLQELQNSTTRGLKVGSEVSDVQKALGTKERGFIQSVKETMPELTDRVSGQYIPRDTDTLAVKAKNLIADKPDEAFHLATTGTDDKAVATASEYIKKLTADAMATTDKALQGHLYDKAAEIANRSAENLTELGRAVQAASILGRLTPEGLVRFAARTVQKYNEGIDTAVAGGRVGAPSLKQIVTGARKIPELTGEQTQEILKQATALQAMPDGLEKARAFKGFLDHLSTLTPSPLWKKMITVWKAGLLTGLKTSGVNMMSNLFHGVSEGVKDIPAAAVDSIASLFTGNRTLALTGKGYASGIKEGAAKGWDYLKTGFDERNISDKLETSKINFGSGPLARAIQAYEETIFKIIGSEDQPFYYGAKAHSLYSQAAAIAKNEGLKGSAAKSRIAELVQEPTDKMLRYSVLDAETAVFQNATQLGKVAKGIANNPIGAVVVPFTKTPSSVAMQILHYSPAGFAKPVARMATALFKKGEFDQRLFSQEVGRASVGTGVMYLGTKLYEQGRIALGRPTSETEQQQWQLEGKSPNSILVDGKWRSVNTLGPAGYTLLLGGYFSRGLQETGSVMGALAQVAAGAGKSLTDQTFLRGLDQAISAVTNPAQSAKSYFTGLIGSLVPTLVSDVARGTDSSERRTSKGMLDYAKSRIPGVRETLEPQIDDFGKPIATPDFLTVMLDPTRPTTAKTADPVVDELRRLWDAGFKATPTQLGDKNGYPALTPAQNTQLWETAGKLAKSKLNSLIQVPQYTEADDEGKQKLIQQITDRAKLVARADMVLQLTQGMTGDTLKQELSRLKAGKFLSQEVFNQYLQLR